MIHYAINMINKTKFSFVCTTTDITITNITENISWSDNKTYLFLLILIFRTQDSYHSYVQYYDSMYQVNFQELGNTDC